MPGRPTIWMTVGQGPIVFAVGAGEGCLDIFSLIYHFSFLSPSLWETARYRLKYCLKDPLKTKQPTNQLIILRNVLLSQLKIISILCSFPTVRGNGVLYPSGCRGSGWGWGGWKG